VALDENGKPKEIPPVIIESDKEIRRNREAAERRKRRLAERQSEEKGR